MAGDRLQELLGLAEANAGKAFRFEGWKVLFTGWKSSHLSVDVAHQWIGRPVEPKGGYWAQRHRSSLATSMPGDPVQVMNPGDMVCPSGHWPQVGYGSDLLKVDMGVKGLLAAGVRITAKVMLAAIDGVIEVPVGYPRERVVFDWARMDDDLWFYLSPIEFMRERCGAVAEDSPDLCQQLYDALYRGGEWPQLKARRGVATGAGLDALRSGQDLETGRRW